MSVVTGWNPNRFELVETHDCLDWMRRQCPDEHLRITLFIYRAVETRIFFVAQWIAYRSVFIPLMAIGKNLNAFNQTVANKFLNTVVGPMSPKQEADIIAGAESDYLHGMETFENERTENRNKMFCDHFPDVPKLADTGAVHLPTDLLKG